LGLIDHRLGSVDAGAGNAGIRMALKSSEDGAVEGPRLGAESRGYEQRSDEKRNDSEAHGRVGLIQAWPVDQPVREEKAKRRPRTPP